MTAPEPGRSKLDPIPQGIDAILRVFNDPRQCSGITISDARCKRKGWASEPDGSYWCPIHRS